jgi:hypothetical protein
MAGAVPLVYSLHSEIMEKHPGSDLAVVARQENARLQTIKPQAYLASVDERRQLGPVVAGAAILTGAAAAAWLVARAGRMPEGVR